MRRRLGSEWLVSDASWKSHKSNAWSEEWRKQAHLGFLEEAIPLEVFDARLFPFGWEQPGFDDSAWQNAALITTRSMAGPGRSQPPAEPYGPLHPRPIGKLGGDRPGTGFGPGAVLQRR